MLLVSDAKFNPISFEEMMRPLLMYKEAYDQTEAAYTQLASQAEVLRNVAMDENNPLAFAMYRNYMNRLSDWSSSFSRGMTRQNKAEIMGLRRDYAKEIAPIDAAYKRKEALAAEQRQAELQNPTMLWQRKAANMSVDDFIRDPSADYGNKFSGALLTQQVAAQASAIAKELQEDPNRMKSIVNGDFYEYVRKRGFTSQAVLAAIARDPNASPILTKMVDGVINASGILGWGDESTIKQAYAYAGEGLWNAVGADEVQVLENWRAKANLEHAQAMARQRQQQAYDTAVRSGLQAHSHHSLNPTDLSAPSRVNVHKNNMKAWIKKGWFTKDGRITVAGRKEMKRQGQLADLVRQYNDEKDPNKKKQLYKRIESAIPSKGRAAVSGTGFYTFYKDKGTPDDIDRSLYEFGRSHGMPRDFIHTSNLVTKNFDDYTRKVASSGDKYVPTIKAYFQDVTTEPKEIR